MARGGREGVGAAQARGDRRGGGGLVRGRGGALVRVMGGGGPAAAAPQSEPETPLASPTPLRAAAHAAPRALLRHRPRGSGGTRWTEGDRWRERGWGGLSVVSSRARAPEGCASLAAAPEAVKLDTAEGGRGGRGGRRVRKHREHLACTRSSQSCPSKPPTLPPPAGDDAPDERPTSRARHSLAFGSRMAGPE